MDISSLAINKGLLIKGFASLSGISGASSGSWYFYDSINPTGYSKFFKEGYKYDPTVFYSNVTSINLTEATKEEEKVNRFNTNSNICVEKYFPTNVIGVDFYKSDDTSTAVSELGYGSLELNNTENNITGCITMKLSTNGSNFIFESETVVKNGDYALVIWSSSWNFKKILLENKVILLKKQNNFWSIMGGFVLSNNALSKVTIKSPDSVINQTFSETTDTTTISGDWSYKYYFGIWESENSESSFENLMSWEQSSEYDLIYKLPTTQSRYVYDNNNSKWWKQSEDVKDSLNKWFKLLENKKGKWKKADDNLINDCKNKSLIRNIDKETKKFLEKYCFRPSGK